MPRAKSNQIFTCTECEKEYKTESGLARHKCKPKPKPVIVHKCDLCENKYKTESGLLNHKCKIKLRMEEYKHAEGRIGFFAYQQFYNRMRIRTNQQKDKTLLDYVKSTYYNGFYTFGKYVVDLNMPFYHEYIDFLITYSIPITKWTSDEVYNTYIKTQNKKEHSERAVEKTLNAMSTWSSKSGKSWKEYFLYEDKYKIMQSIRIGKISPWVIYNSRSGKAFMQTLDSSDLNQIFDFIDPNYWSLKFSRHQKEQIAIEETLASFNV